MSRAETKGIGWSQYPLVLLGYIIVGGYNILFGWWLDKLLARKRERQLQIDVMQTLQFLFHEHQGKIVKNEGVPFPPGFDYAFATVSVGDILILFCRGRGELNVRVAANSIPNEWHDLSLLLGVLYGDDRRRPGIVNLEDAARLLQGSMESLKIAFAGGVHLDVQQKLDEAYKNDKAAIREAEWEINKRFSSTHH